MSATSINGVSTPISIDGSSPRKLKILMLHGYTQTGPLFHAKTRALEKTLHKAFPATRSSPLFSIYPGGIQLIYPTGPILLHPSDIPSFSPAFTTNSSSSTSTPSSSTPSTPPNESDTQPDAWAWWTRDATTGEYLGLGRGLDTIREQIIQAGGIDGVIGFSQGGAFAAMIASLLEPTRASSFSTYLSAHPNSFHYPLNWTTLSSEVNQKPLKFAVSYSGFYAPDERYGAFYEPKIETQLLSVMGGLDSVVEEGRTLGLVERCAVGRARTVTHPGGHFVPVGKEWVGVLAGWIRECCWEGEGEGKEKKEGL